ncbi:MAG: hypothetical protein FJX57_16650 [Alphaproteobacteria bacterium]|nr:hypothetical protein [Alphaproteobacteria bacterium]
MTRIAVAAIAALGMLSCAAPASADQPASCFKRPDLIKYLSSNFKEAPVAVGVTDAGMLLEVFTTRSGETWTVAVTTPHGLTCLMATGQDWQTVPRAAEFGPPA